MGGRLWPRDRSLRGTARGTELDMGGVGRAGGGRGVPGGRWLCLFHGDDPFPALLHFGHEYLTTFVNAFVDAFVFAFVNSPVNAFVDVFQHSSPSICLASRASSPDSVHAWSSLKYTLPLNRLMAFRRTTTVTAPSSYPPVYSNPAESNHTSLSGPPMPQPTDPASPNISNKRQRLDSLQDPAGPVAADDAFIHDQDAGESGGDDDDEDDKPKSDKKAGRRKIKIEFIQDKSRRHITFSKRKAGIMKKAYELSTLTGTQVLLLVVSETGLVYTFTTAKLQPLVTQPEGKNLIQACLNAPHGTLPSSMPIGTPIGRASGPLNMPHHAPPNVPGGLSISGGGSGKDDDASEEQDADAPAPAEPPERTTRKRRRASSSAGTAAPSRNNAPSAVAVSPAQGSAPGAPSTSPHARTAPIPPMSGGPPPSLSIPGGPGAQQQQMPLEHSPRQQPTSPNYTHANPAGGYGAPQQGDPGMYGAPPGAGPQGHGGYPGAPPPYSAFGHDAPPGSQGGMATHGGPWGPPPVQQGSHYGRR
ncbi:hypothetical protein A0H81_11128 [Grifola frondosa]|uniref:MADS-box domain-containing protein n=1 Tax=Grifola frondosa TaxID=5627 RepID=A0A1C7LWY0_GRIFR|nr:hypothetical protein A0H81_11128 [Grifola frondosa]